jgi:aryl-alcohol dehydrogenase-like predicted oxidoreductase
MEYATLGNTGLLVSKLCFGTMTFGNGRGLFQAIGSVGQAGADELVKTSIDGGINFFDTADNYTSYERSPNSPESASISAAEVRLTAPWLSMKHHASSGVMEYRRSEANVPVFRTTDS